MILWWFISYYFVDIVWTQSFKAAWWFQNRTCMQGRSFRLCFLSFFAWTAAGDHWAILIRGGGRGLRPWRVNRPEAWDSSKSISLRSETQASQSPWGLRLQQVKLPCVWNPSESISTGLMAPASQSHLCLKPWWVNLPESDAPLSQSPWGLRLRQVNLIPWGDWLAGVWYLSESISLRYQTPGSQFFPT